MRSAQTPGSPRRVLAVPCLLAEFVAALPGSPLALWAASTPWALTCRAETVVRELLTALDGSQYHVNGEVAVHRSATVEATAMLKGPLIVGPGCFIAAGAYLRGGNWLAERCVLGPGAELKSSFVFAGSHLAHFNFVGDSVLGEDVNLEAGSIICNHRNERADKEVRVRWDGGLRRTGCEKFGALVGDGGRIGANAVLAPGSLLRPGAIVPRAALYDDDADGP